MRARRASRTDEGFTLIELMVSMVLFGTLVAMGTMPLRSYQLSQEHLGAARDVVAALRNAQVRAVNEGTVYKVEFSPQQVRVYRVDNNVPTLSRSYTVPSSITLTTVAPGFTPSATPTVPTPAPGADAYFYGRGTASAGSVRVTRRSSSKTYTISIEGLTARVSLS